MIAQNSNMCPFSLLASVDTVELFVGSTGQRSVHVYHSSDSGKRVSSWLLLKYKVATFLVCSDCKLLTSKAASSLTRYYETANAVTWVIIVGAARRGEKLTACVECNRLHLQARKTLTLMNQAKPKTTCMYRYFSCLSTFVFGCRTWPAGDYFSTSRVCKSFLSATTLNMWQGQGINCSERESGSSGDWWE